MINFNELSNSFGQIVKGLKEESQSAQVASEKRQEKALADLERKHQDQLYSLGMKLIGMLRSEGEFRYKLIAERVGSLEQFLALEEYSIFPSLLVDGRDEDEHQILNQAFCEAGLELDASELDPYQSEKDSSWDNISEQRKEVREGVWVIEAFDSQECERTYSLEFASKSLVKDFIEAAPEKRLKLLGLSKEDISSYICDSLLPDEEE